LVQEHLLHGVFKRRYLAVRVHQFIERGGKTINPGGIELAQRRQGKLQQRQSRRGIEHAQGGTLALEQRRRLGAGVLGDELLLLVAAGAIRAQ
jgi:hypothetical protein